MRRWLHRAVGVGACLLGLLMASEAMAQARRVVPPGAIMVPQAALGRGGIVIKKLEAIGPNAKIRTPEYRTDAGEVSNVLKDWARILVQYDTEADWIDELEFRYSVLVKHPRSNVLTMFPGTVTYIDVAKGRRHQSAMFLRPATLERHGAVEWAGVKIYLKGELVAQAQVPDDARPWTLSCKTQEGVLLNRAQTPFALVAYDNYETIKPK